MYAARWTVYLIRLPVFLAVRCFSSRLWLLVAFVLMLAVYETSADAASIVITGTAIVWFVFRVASSYVTPGERPRRPLGYQKPTKKKPAPVAGSLAVAIDSPSAEIARLRLAPNLQAIMMPMVREGAPVPGRALGVKNAPGRPQRAVPAKR